jgi:hypothetical protein
MTEAAPKEPEAAAPDALAELIERLDEMARRLGCRFVPDPMKIAAYRAALMARAGR